MPIDAPIHVNEANLSRVLGAGLPVLLVFWQRECATCDQLAPTLGRLAKSYAGRGLIAKVNVTDEAGLAQRYKIARLPTVIFNKEGQEIGQAIGAVSEVELITWLDHLTGVKNVRPPVPSGPSVPWSGAAAAPAPQGPTRASGAAAPGESSNRDGQPITLTDASFDRVIRESRVPVLVDFWAAWCGPCKMIAPAVADLARDFAGRAVVGKLNVDENPRTAGRFNVMSIPTLLIFKNGQVVDQIVGALPAPALRQRFAQHVG